LAEGIKLLQLSNFHLFFIKFVLFLELFFEFLVRSKELKVLEIVLNDRILRAEVDFQLFFVGLLLAFFGRNFIFFKALKLLRFVHKFTKRIFVVVRFFMVLNFYLFWFFFFERLFDWVFTVGLAKEFWAFAQFWHGILFLVLFALFEWSEVKVWDLPVW
jgi:hypothetical protein